jgi:hypothetical protein
MIHIVQIGRNGTLNLEYSMKIMSILKRCLDLTSKPDKLSGNDLIFLRAKSEMFYSDNKTSFNFQ